MEFRPEVRRSWGLVARRYYLVEREEGVGRDIKRNVDHHLEIRDPLFGQEPEMDDDQRDFLFGEPRVLEPRTRIRCRR